MSKRRKAPGSGSKPFRDVVPYALENEVLGLVLSSRTSSSGAQVRGLQARHPELAAEEAAALVERCSKVRDAAFSLVAAVVAQGEGSPRAAGRILDAYPWMSLRNVEAICSEGFHLAIM